MTMLERIRQWIKEVLSKMIPVKNIKQALPDVDLAITDAMNQAIAKWETMYTNPKDYVGLPSALASDVARMATVEMEVSVTGSPRADYLSEQLKPLIKDIKRHMEFCAALGGVVFKPYPSGDDIAIDVYKAGYFYPVSFNATGIMTSAVFVDVKTVGKKYYTRLEYHKYDNNEKTHTIINSAFVSDNKDDLGRRVSLSVVADWAELVDEWTFQNVDKPLFAYVKMPIANNVDTNSPLGVSIYSNAVDLIEQVAKRWDEFMWEYKSGERALYTDVHAFEKDKDGKAKLPDRRLYRLLDLQTQIGGKGLFEDWSPTIRQADYINGIDAILKRIEYAVGISYGTISDPNSVDKTATEIKLSKQRLYVLITDMQKALEDGLEILLYAMDYYATAYNLSPAGTYNTVYNFDDSVVTDKEEIIARDQRELALGIMSKLEYRMKTKGEDEATARKQLALVKEEQGGDGFFGEQGA